MSEDSKSTVPSGAIPNPRTKNLINRRFGRLLVVSFSHYGNNNMLYWNCVCDCGKEKIIRGTSVSCGITISCGCYKLELNRAGRYIKHGLCNKSSRIVQIWTGIIQRCTNQNNPHYKDYGGRGITICEKWRHDVNEFYNHVGDRPSKNHSIDRIDVNGNYEPGNVRWATMGEQNNNTRVNVKFTISGISETATYWSKISGTNRKTILSRHYRNFSDYECVYGRSISILN